MIADSHLVADPVFFEAPERMTDQDTLFDVSRRPAPRDWSRAERGLWVGWHPSGLTLPAQGWKVHLSVCPEHADAALAATVDFCVEHRLALKFLRSTRAHRLTNLKYAARGSSGKLAAIYPEDATRLTLVLDGLGSRLAGTPGPYVLGDLRWADGPLYLRYGAFLDQWAADEDDGEPTLAIERPDRTHEADRRGPVFRIPPWADVPATVLDALAVEESTPADLPLMIDEALHHSNAGGVYLARDSGGTRVVVKEARPHAGLDPSGRDAVARLRREAEVLRRLDDTGVAPRCLDELTVWEHRFLVEELVDGVTLHAYMAQHHPYLHPEPANDELEEYARWGLALADRVATALAKVHARGLVFADLHANNVMVRHDGSVVLIDAELATEIDGSEPVRLGDPAYRHRRVEFGRALDDYALACLRLAVFIPLTGLLVWDPELAADGTAEKLVAAAERLFPLPPGWGAEVLAALRGAAATNPARAPKPPGVSGAAPDVREPDLARQLVRTSLSWATPDRDDRLYPGDPWLQTYGGCGVLHGAAGVLHTAATVAPELVHDDHVDWLARSALTTDSPYSGLLTGAAGAALVLARLGRLDCALEVFARSGGTRHLDRTAGLLNGAAGRSLAAQALASIAGGRAEGLDAIAQDEVAALRGLLRGDTTRLTEPVEAGLLRGWAGVALCLVRQYEQTGERALLDDAALALRRGLAYCMVDGAGALHVRDGDRILLYLGDGAIGVGLAIQAILRHRDDPDLVAALSAVRRTCHIGVVMFGGLLNGRAGLLLGSALLLEGEEREQVTALHRERLAWHLVTEGGQPAMPGDGLVRLSGDLATGNAGAALALHAAAAPAATLDLILLGAPAGDPWSRAVPDPTSGGR